MAQHSQDVSPPHHHLVTAAVTAGHAVTLEQLVTTMGRSLAAHVLAAQWVDGGRGWRLVSMFRCAEVGAWRAQVALARAAAQHSSGWSKAQQTHAGCMPAWQFVGTGVVLWWGTVEWLTVCPLTESLWVL